MSPNLGNPKVSEPHDTGARQWLGTSLLFAVAVIVSIVTLRGW
jgi:hypothetical protein